MSYKSLLAGSKEATAARWVLSTTGKTPKLCTTITLSKCKSRIRIIYTTRMRRSNPCIRSNGRSKPILWCLQDALRKIAKATTPMPTPTSCTWRMRRRITMRLVISSINLKASPKFDRSIATGTETTSSVDRERASKRSRRNYSKKPVSVNSDREENSNSVALPIPWSNLRRLSKPTRRPCTRRCTWTPITREDDLCLSCQSSIWVNYHFADELMISC